MKKLALLVVGVLFSFCASAQDVSTDIFTATAPAGATQITGQPLQEYLQNNFKVTLVPSNQENTYLAGGVIICFWALPGGTQHPKPLEEQQTRMIAVLQKNNTVNYSRIETINNVRFLIYEFQNDGEVFLRFGSQGNSKDQTMRGILQFKEADKDKAHQYLKALLASMRFKEQ